MKTVIKILFLLLIPFTIQFCSKAVEYKSTNTTGNGSSSGTGSNGPGINNPAATPYSPGQAGVYFPVDTTDTSKTHPAALYITLTRTGPCTPTGELFNFAAVSYNIPSNATYSWSMGDGIPMYTSTVTGYKYTYPKFYKVTVTASYSGKTISKDTTIYAYGTSVKPQAVFYITQPQSTNPNYIALVNQTMSSVTFKVFWNLGDGTLDSTNYSPTHTYASSSVDKTYRILLTAKGDSSGCTDTVSHAITILGIPATPSCNINYNQSDSCGPGKESFNFGGIVTGAPAGATYNWDFGDGTTDIGSSVTKQYTNPSNYLVKLTVSNSTLSCSKTVKAFGVNNFPVANYTYTVNSSGDMFTFQDSTVLKSGNLTQFFWDFGDGITAHIAAPTHTFTKDVVSKSYKVLYGVKAANNCTSNITKTVVVPSL